MESGQAKEQTIVDRLGELRELLRKLKMSLGNLTRRNPVETADKPQVAQRPDNVFDEIVEDLAECKGLVREIAEGLEAGISRKVQ